MFKVILIGGFHEIIELAEENQMEIMGIIDKQGHGNYRNYKIICDDKNAPRLNDYYKEIPILITPDNPAVRRKLAEYYATHGFVFSSLISNKANVSKTAVINKGTIVQAGVNVSAEVIIGSFVKLNTLCNIMHNSNIGDFTTIAPNAVILGNVIVGQYCYIGSNSTILPNVTICDNVRIGAGAVVTKHILIPGTYTGVPAKSLRSTL
jgi:sugar O-acyltransferase (sialic acid O-acetyltransferase NeuD family)